MDYCMKTPKLKFDPDAPQVYADRIKIPHPPGGELETGGKVHPAGGKSCQGFSPQLSWSHYRALMRVVSPDARAYYEEESAECGWTKTQLERQIHTSYYERIIKAKGPAGILPANRKRLPLSLIHI